MSLAISKYIPRIQCIPRPNNSCTKPASSPSSSPSPSSSVSEQYLHSTQQPLLPSYLPPFSSLVLQEQEKHSSPRPSPTSPKGPFSNSILQTVCPSGWERVNRWSVRSFKLPNRTNLLYFLWMNWMLWPFNGAVMMNWAPDEWLVSC